jgi:hypothetical protein
MCVVFMFELLQNEYWLYGCGGELWYASPVAVGYYILVHYHVTVFLSSDLI